VTSFRRLKYKESLLYMEKGMDFLRRLIKLQEDLSERDKAKKPELDQHINKLLHFKRYLTKLCL